MLHRVLSLKSRRSSPTQPGSLHFRPKLEAVEERTVPHVSVGAGNLLALDVSSVQVVNGALEAMGSVDGNSRASFTTPINISTTASTTGGSPTLDLSVNPISTNQRAISFATSPLDLSVTPATGAATGSLGAVLTNVATELSGGMSLQDVLAGLSSTDLATLTSGIQDMLNQSLAQVTTDSSVSTASGKPGKFGTLELSSAPSNLTVDGQSVAVSNGTGGPITLTITAGGAQGHLLDNLFHKLGNDLANGNTSAEAKLLASITQRIDLIEGIKVG